MKTILITHSDLDGVGNIIIAQTYGLPIDEFYIYTYEPNEEQTIIKKVAEADMAYLTDVAVIDADVFAQLKATGTEFYIFDHHEGTEAIAHEPNVYYDGDKCGTKIFFEWLNEHLGKKRVLSILQDFVNLVDVYDLWKLDDPLRETAENLNRVLWKSVLYGLEGYDKYVPFIDNTVRKLKSTNHSQWFFNDKEKQKIAEAMKREHQEYVKATQMLQVRRDEREVPFGLFMAGAKISNTCSKVLADRADIKYIICINTYGGVTGRISVRSKEGFNCNDLAWCDGHAEAAGGQVKQREVIELWEGKIRSIPYAE